MKTKIYQIDDKDIKEVLAKFTQEEIEIIGRFNNLLGERIRKEKQG